ncbi:outer membrane protein OmpK [Shewanella frigidimarina]|uniref:nucleoside-specific channel-forming Tsx family protein n=1 Tax=Shewanella frigidimarina TaxID=56812 RepID=UPI003D798B64
MMKKLNTLVLASTVALAGSAFTASAAEQTGDIHANDYKWMQFNIMYAIDEHPIANKDEATHNYLEMEFGGRSGFVDLYGYVDVFNLGNRDSGDKTNNASKMFMKLAPRFSLDAITGTDLSFGPVQEVYISTLFNWGGGGTTGSYTANTQDFSGSLDAYTQGDTNMSFWGVGADVMVPWLGKTGMNLYGTYDLNRKDWNGYQFSANWFKPFVFFDDKSFLSFQGYVDYQFDMDEEISGKNIDGNFNNTEHGGAGFLGLYYHTDRFALGYGAKYFYHSYGLNDNAFKNQFWDGLNTTGWTHFLTATYKI